jgi:NAD(P)-dependent dehydrogenase (short-subunit alcohol dehydrogenase family)
MEGKKFVVTGAASGIGAATARELIRRGARVIGVDRNPMDGLEHALQADLRDRQAIEELIALLPDDLDGLANVAGLPPTAHPGDVIRVNLAGLRHLTIGLIPKLRDGASIVNLVSSAGNRWAEHLDQIIEYEQLEWDDIDDFARRHHMDVEGRSYFFSKEALLVWTMRNRWTWIDRGIRINAVSPGPIDTPILPDFVTTLGPRAQRSLEATERLGTPEDVAPVVAFLLSDDSAWFRGSNLTPDGGLSAHMLLGEHGLH